LDESQHQVRELLPYRENAVRLKTELDISRQMLKSKDEENERLHRTLTEERQERQRQNRALQEDTQRQVQEKESRLQKLEQDLSNLQIEQLHSTRDIERKTKSVAQLDEGFV